MSTDVAKQLKLTQHLLKNLARVKGVGKSLVPCTHFVRCRCHLGDLAFTVSLRLIPTQLQILLGYPFLCRFQPAIDWRKRTLTIDFHGHRHTVAATNETPLYTSDTIARDPLPAVQNSSTSPESDIPVYEIDATDEDLPN